MHDRNRTRLAEALHNALPPSLRTYLHDRGVPDAVIEGHLLGWNGRRITIPVPTRWGEIGLFRYARVPGDHAGAPKMLTEAGRGVDLYGWDTLARRPDRVVVSEGEFDRLVLEAQGISAVTSTGGAGVFRPEWAEALRGVKDIYLCYDRDEAGAEGARRVSALLPHAKIVALPEEVGPGGDVTDFFVRLKRTKKAFLALLAAARPGPAGGPSTAASVDGLRRPSRSPATLSSSAAIGALVGRYVRLRRSGARLVGRCPFHPDRCPSFNVYPETGSFHCFGCGAHGDAAGFLMRLEGLTFPEALGVLRRLTPTL